MALAVTASATWWATTAAARTSRSGPRETARGEDLYQRDCAVCHGPSGTGSFRGPPIDHTGTADVDFMLTTGRMPIVNPEANVGRSNPRYSPDEITALVEYVHTFVSGPEVPTVDTSRADLAAGGEVYRLNCASCHQAVGAGGALAYGVTAPPLDKATPTQVVEALRVGPGVMPVFGPDQLPDDQATDVAAYVEYLRQPDDRGGLSLFHLGPVPEGLVAWVIGLGGAFVLIRWLGTRDPLPD